MKDYTQISFEPDLLRFGISDTDVLPYTKVRYCYVCKHTYTFVCLRLQYKIIDVDMASMKTQYIG
jgi:hypothetical protein